MDKIFPEYFLASLASWENSRASWASWLPGVMIFWGLWPVLFLPTLTSPTPDRPFWSVHSYEKSHSASHSPNMLLFANVMRVSSLILRGTSGKGFQGSGTLTQKNISNGLMKLEKVFLAKRFSNNPRTPHPIAPPHWTWVEQILCKCITSTLSITVREVQRKATTALCTGNII